MRCLRESERRMGASVELRMRGDCDSQLAQCAVRGQAPLLQQARVPATTEAVSNAGDGGSAMATRE